MPRVKLTDFKEKPVLTHLKRLTTNKGILQHSDCEVPDPSHGYSIDDNARALIACLWHYQIFKDESILRLAEIYFYYIKKVEKEEGTFHNFLSFTEKTLDAEGSEDSVGRAIWALGETVRWHPDKEIRKEADAIFNRSNISKHLEHPHVRTKAFILLGLYACGSKDNVKIWADRICQMYEQNMSDKWQWFEDSVRYDNGIIPYALTQAFRRTRYNKYLKVARSSFDWLSDISQIRGKPSPIGQKQWFAKGGEKSIFDQQPLEAAAMILASTSLFQVTKNKKYLQLALRWMSWYRGNNIKRASAINNQTGGIFDGITPEGVNKNQGAESIVTYLLAYLALSKIAYGKI